MFVPLRCICSSRDHAQGRAWFRVPVRVQVTMRWMCDDGTSPEKHVGLPDGCKYLGEPER